MTSTWFSATPKRLLKATAGAGSENIKEVRCRLALAVASAQVAYDRLKEMTVKAAKATDHVIREIHISPLRSPEAPRCSSEYSWDAAVNPHAARAGRTIRQVCPAGPEAGQTSMEYPRCHY